MNIKVSSGTYKNCILERSEYPNKQILLTAYYKNEILTKATVNMPDNTIPKNHVCIKDWSENKGILESLIKNNVIEQPRFFIQTSFVIVHVCKLI